MTGPERSPGTPDLPDYAGSADTGVVGSVGDHAAAAGDVVQALGAEHTKLRGLFDEMMQLVRTDDRDALRLRWGGVVRELVEHEAAEARVVLPAAENAAGAGAVADVRRGQQELLDRLQAHDAFTADDVSPQDVAEAIDAAAAHLDLVDSAVLPLLQQLPADERGRLGEDLRQVMG